MISWRKTGPNEWEMHVDGSGYRGLLDREREFQRGAALPGQRKRPWVYTFTCDGTCWAMAAKDLRQAKREAAEIVNGL